MDQACIQKLNCMTGAFYRCHAASFSETRQAPWPGWLRVAERMRHLGGDDVPLQVLDVASGNGRFERFLAQQLPQRFLQCYTVDNCDDLVTDASRAGFAQSHQRLDLVDALARGTLGPSLQAPRCQAVVCFGFLHHVPSRQLRLDLLDTLLDATEPGGLVAISLWRFMNDEAQAAKVRKGAAAALQAARAYGIGPDDLEPGDYLLGWRGDFRVPRYCHSFSEGEIACLLDAVGERIVRCERFRSDGRSGILNEYVLLHV